jgi:hypothetical protein
MSNLLQNGNSIAGHGDRIQGFVLENGVEDLILVIATERGLPEQHLVGQHAECPPVNSTAVALFEKNLIN